MGHGLNEARVTRAMKVIGVIPARGGSKGVERKNLRTVAGYPLVVWTLAVAEKACDAVIVTSDDMDILHLATTYRTTCLVRDGLLAHARVPDLPVVQDAYRRGVKGQQPDDIIVLLRPTAPFRTEAEIREVVGLLGMTADSVRSVLPSKERPDKSYKETGYTQEANNGRRFPILEPWTGKHHKANHPRQFLPNSWRACGFIDAVRGDVIRGGHMEGDSILGWPAPAERAIDIDDEADLEYAQALASRKGWTPGNVA